MALHDSCNVQFWYCVRWNTTIFTITRLQASLFQGKHPNNVNDDSTFFILNVFWTFTVKPSCVLPYLSCIIIAGHSGWMTELGLVLLLCHGIFDVLFPVFNFIPWLWLIHHLIHILNPFRPQTILLSFSGCSRSGSGVNKTELVIMGMLLKGHPVHTNEWGAQRLVSWSC